MNSLLTEQPPPAPTVSSRETARSSAPLKTAQVKAKPEAVATVKPTSWWKRFCVPPRIQAFEFCDQSWLKGVWRETYLDGLNFLFHVTGIYRQTYRPFAEWAQAAGGKKVLDLACGGAAHIADLLQNSQKNGILTPKIVLSDLFPDTEAFQRVKEAFPGKVDFLASSVNATETAKHNIRLHSIFGAFHHFSPKNARKVLQNATHNADGLFIMEVFNRNWLTPFTSLPNFPLLLLAPFFSKRFSWKKLLLGTLLPIIPLMIVFDGVISSLRSYRQEEILALLPECAKSEWQWESGSLSVLGGIHQAPYVFGFRKKD